MGCKRHIQCEVYVCAECRNEALDVLMAEVEQSKGELSSARQEVHAYAVLKIERDGYKEALTKIAENAQNRTVSWCQRAALFGLGKGEPAR